MKALQQLLDEVGSLALSIKMRHEEKLARGEMFNIFEILRLYSDETNFHSRILAYLLDPTAAHGMADFFQKTFLELVMRSEERRVGKEC